MTHWTKRSLERELRVRSDDLLTFLIALLSTKIGDVSTIGYGSIKKLSADTFQISVDDKTIEETAQFLVDEANAQIEGENSE
jgi:hypothetical protein